VVDDLPAGLDERERRTWYAPTSDGRTLVTTRDRRHGGTGGILDLATLNYEDAYQLLTERRASSAALTLADQQVAREVVQALGAHALALDVAGGYLAANPELPLAAFLRALTESKRDVLALAAELGDELPNGHERNVAATLMTSIASLGEEGRDLLRLGSVLASVPIPRTLADSVFRRADLLSQIDAQARTNRALEQAGALSLVEVIGDEGTSRIKIHALVSRSVHLREPVSGPGGWSSFMGAMDLLRRHRSTRGVLLREAAFAEISQALGGADDIRRSIEVARYVEHARRMTERPETVDEVKLLASVGRYYFRQGAFRDARQVDERVLDARRRLHGKKHPLTLIAMGNLAVSVAAMGERETALVLQQEVLRYRRRLLGDEHRDTLTALSNVAQLLQAQGSLREAREIQERVLATWRRVAGDDHPDTLTAEHNLAGNLKESGDRTAAKELFERVFEAKKRVLGEDHAATLRTLAELADIAREDGDFRTAREFQESIVEIFGHVVEEDHPSTVAAEQKLAETLFEEGDVPNALQHLYRVLEVRRQRLGEEHPETLSAMNDLAVALDGHGDLSVARQLHQRVLEVRQRVLGRDDAATIGTLNNLAGVLVKQGDLKTARKLLERVVDVFQAKFGDESPATLRATNNLAEAVRAQGDLASARTLHGRTLEISRRVLGNRHPDTTRSAWNLYLVLKELHPSAASRLFQQDLSWLSQARSEALSGDQRMIREHLSSLGAFLDAVAGRSQTKPSSKPPFIN
jgi:tetratricopeptide (TPR) repeat protein